MRQMFTAGLAAVALTAAFAQPTVVAAQASLLASVEDPPPAPAEGTIVNYTFSAPPMNSFGAKSLADLRGRPVLIEFWGTR